MKHTEFSWISEHARYDEPDMSEPCPIRFCVLNPRSNEERDDLLAQGCEMRDCLGQCSLCFETRFLVTDTQTIEGESYPAILARARKNCQQHRDTRSTAAPSV
jgi:uncharacterized protein YuzB (UPF0349 family)